MFCYFTIGLTLLAYMIEMTFLKLKTILYVGVASNIFANLRWSGTCNLAYRIFFYIEITLHKFAYTENVIFYMFMNQVNKGNSYTSLIIFQYFNDSVH